MKTISWVAIFISLISLSLTLHVCFSQKTYETDYIGSVISVLGILVTVLIGWNIYTVIDFKNQVNDITNNANDAVANANCAAANANKAEMMAHKCLAETYSAISNAYSGMYDGVNLSKNETGARMVFFRLNCAYEFYLIGDTEQATNCIGSIEADKNILSNIILSDDYYNVIIGLLEDMEKLFNKERHVLSWIKDIEHVPKEEYMTKYFSTKPN